MAGVALTVTVTVFDVAVVGVGQAAVDVKIHVTFAPFVNEEDEYEALFVPTFDPFTCHWYVGVVPPFVAVAVYVALVPEQIEVVPEIEIEGVTYAFTVVVMAFEVAGLLVAPAKFEVIIQVTICPVVNDVVVYVGLFVPTLEPFTCHW